jgi:DNA-binding transcriptional regulator YdaS (Cro superfamily)
MVATAGTVGPSVNDLRVAFALRPHVRAYRVAARAGVSPVVLSRVLNGYRAVSAEMALDIHRAILEEERAAGAPSDG